MNKVRIACSKYSDLDDKVINKASELGFPLIGGTALEILADYYKVDGVRKRSDNDLDFISKDNKNKYYFMSWVQENIDPEKVDVDFYDEAPNNYKDYIMNVNGVLVMSPTYLMWSKLTRGTNKDITDVKWLLSIPQLTDNEIVEAMEDLILTDDEIDLLQSLL